MNPLRPSAAMLRRIARAVETADDRTIRAWAEAVDRKFSAVSVVKTYRNGALCGYEVWRHLATSVEDPRRHKARLWFGVRHWQSELGYQGAALHMARKAARRLSSMNRRELGEWWQERSKQRANRTKRRPEDYLLEVRLDYTELQRMSHVFSTT